MFWEHSEIPKKIKSIKQKKIQLNKFKPKSADIEFKYRKLILKKKKKGNNEEKISKMNFMEIKKER